MEFLKKKFAITARPIGQKLDVALPRKSK